VARGFPSRPRVQRPPRQKQDFWGEVFDPLHRRDTLGQNAPVLRRRLVDGRVRLGLQAGRMAEGDEIVPGEIPPEPQDRRRRGRRAPFLASEPEVGQGAPRRRGKAGRARPLDFEPQASPSPYDEKVKFRSRVSGPEIAVLVPGPDPADDLVQDKSLPRRAELRVAFQVPQRRLVEEGVDYIEISALSTDISRYIN
jgi:hypothetical protein